MYQNIIDDLQNIVCYLDLYDELGEIDDDSFRQELEVYIQKAESNATDIDEVISEIKTRLEAYKGDGDIPSVISSIESAGNNQDLYNVIEDVDDRAVLSEDIIDAMRQIYKNNRYRSLEDTKQVLIKFLNDIDTEKSNIVEGKLLEYSKDDISNDDSNSPDETEKDIRDKRIFQSMKDEKEDKTLLDMLQDRIGEQMSVGEFNTVLQSLFGQFNKVFLMTSDLYSKDLEANQSLTVNNDDDQYIINYDIVDMNNGIIEITDVSVE